ncbi:MAG: helix-turn-helix domain-containing protein [Rhodoglobus sp.]
MAEARDIESRLTALEQALGLAAERPTVAGSEVGHQPVDDALWALEGLRVRAPAGGAVLYTGTVDLPPGGTVRWQYAVPATAVLDQDWTDYAPALLALGHPVRLQILHAVLHGTATVAALVETLDTGTSGQIYHHLKELASAGWLVSGRRGTHEVPPSRIVPLLAILVAAGTPG